MIRRQKRSILFTYTTLFRSTYTYIHIYWDVLFDSVMMHDLLKGYSITFSSKMDKLPQERSRTRQQVKQLEVLLVLKVYVYRVYKYTQGG